MELRKRKEEEEEEVVKKKAVPEAMLLPHELCLEIVKHVHESEALALAMTCSGFRDSVKDNFFLVGEMRRKVTTTSLNHFLESGVPVSEEWIKWLFGVLKKDEKENLIRKRVSSSCQRKLFGLSALHGYLEVLKFLRKKKCKMNPSGSEDEVAHESLGACEYAARGGHLETLKWLRAEGCEWGESEDNNACVQAAKGGFLKTIKWAVSKGCSLTIECHKKAAYFGHVKVLQWLEKQSECDLDDSILSGSAAEGGQTEVLKYLKRRGAAFDKSTCARAALGGHIDVLEYLKGEGLSFYNAENHILSETAEFIGLGMYGDNIPMAAARGGHIHVLEYLKSEGMPFDAETSSGAAASGHIEVLKYLKREGVPFDYLTCKGAARGGHIHVLKYLKNEGVAFDAETCEYAARAGHIDVLKYLKSEGVPFDSWICECTALDGQLEVLKWLRSEEVNCPWDVTLCLDAAIQNDDEDMIEFLENALADRYETDAVMGVSIRL